MHEMPIVLNVVRSMDVYAQKNHIPDIKVVVVDIGDASSVVPFFFRSCWDPAVGQSYHLQNAALEINEIPCKAKCRKCGAEFRPGRSDANCPECGFKGWDLISGRDISIKEILVE